MNYFPQEARDSWEVIDDGRQGLRCALCGRARLSQGIARPAAETLRPDRRLSEPAETLTTEPAGRFSYRVFTDSAPVMEVELASKAGIGWRGKHTLLLNREAGSWFFLGEIYTDLTLPVDDPQPDHCGTCRRCIDICPTGAIVAPYQLDARRCISYLTIEHKGEIPEELRPLMGNRIYGCDDCQLVCPWNRYAQKTDVDRLLGSKPARCRGSDGTVCLERGRIRAASGRQRHPQDRPRALAAESGGGSGQCPDIPRRGGGARSAARPSLGAGTKPCRVGTEKTLLSLTLSRTSPRPSPARGDGVLNRRRVHWLDGAFADIALRPRKNFLSK